MDQINLNSYSKISNFNVSRETCNELESYISLIQRKNKEINIISKKNTKKDDIRQRHIIDSAQIIDFVDINSNTTYDLGSGAGLPGVVLGILMRQKKPLFKMIFYEKSYHKSNFLKEMAQKYKLNSKIYKKNIFDEKNLKTDVIISRAFTPLPIIFEIAFKNLERYKNQVPHL